jgi:hypothetical protein
MRSTPPSSPPDWATTSGSCTGRRPRACSGRSSSTTTASSSGWTATPPARSRRPPGTRDGTRAGGTATTSTS